MHFKKFIHFVVTLIFVQSFFSKPIQASPSCKVCDPREIIPTSVLVIGEDQYGSFASKQLALLKFGVFSKDTPEIHVVQNIEQVRIALESYSYSCKRIKHLVLYFGGNSHELKISSAPSGVVSTRNFDSVYSLTQSSNVGLCAFATTGKIEVELAGYSEQMWSCESQFLLEAMANLVFYTNGSAPGASWPKDIQTNLYSSIDRPFWRTAIDCSKAYKFFAPLAISTIDRFSKCTIAERANFGAITSTYGAKSWLYKSFDSLHSFIDYDSPPEIYSFTDYFKHLRAVSKLKHLGEAMMRDEVSVGYGASRKMSCPSY